MARYIDAVDCAEIISKECNIPLGDLVDVFAKVPTADVVEVVRCKDCKHWKRNPPEYTDYPFTRESTDGFCSVLWISNHSEYSYTDEDHFCSDGERSDT